MIDVVEPGSARADERDVAVASTHRFRDSRIQESGEPSGPDTSRLAGGHECLVCGFETAFSALLEPFQKPASIRRRSRSDCVSRLARDAVVVPGGMRCVAGIAFEDRCHASDPLAATAITPVTMSAPSTSFSRVNLLSCKTGSLRRAPRSGCDYLFCCPSGASPPGFSFWVLVSTVWSTTVSSVFSPRYWSVPWLLPLP